MYSGDPLPLSKCNFPNAIFGTIKSVCVALFLGSQILFLVVQRYRFCSFINHNFKLFVGTVFLIRIQGEYLQGGVPKLP